MSDYYQYSPSPAVVQRLNDKKQIKALKKKAAKRKKKKPAAKKKKGKKQRSKNK